MRVITLLFTIVVSTCYPKEFIIDSKYYKLNLQSISNYTIIDTANKYIINEHNELLGNLTFNSDLKNITYITNKHFILAIANRYVKYKIMKNHFNKRVEIVQRYKDAKISSFSYSGLIWDMIVLDYGDYAFYELYSWKKVGFGICLFLYKNDEYDFNRIINSVIIK